jgi:hypothetical protein
VNTGKEVTAPRNGKAARKAANDAKHKAKMENNKNYAEAKRKAGERKGKFRKGNK